MTDKTGNRRQRLASCFDKTPASGTSTCPFKGPDIAIVPVRYALDRSRHDSNPNALKPLPTQGRWTVLPQLQSRPYTLRQLQDGYLYVFDETAKTLHEYQYRAKDACLTRIIWGDAHVGQDQRKPKADQNSDAKPYLLYPRKHVLHIAYAPMQWTWRICEHLRSHEGSRAQWMKRLDLAAYSLSMNEPDTLPLSELALAVADIDAGQVTEDARFADTSVPTQAPTEAPTKGQKPNWVAVGADVHWLGSVPDKDSALLIALDDPLAVLQDLGLQLAADQAAYHVWQEEHEHRIQIANIVSQLCGLPSEPKEKLPETVRGDPGRTQAYLLEAEAYLEQWTKENEGLRQQKPNSNPLEADDGEHESLDMFIGLKSRYNVTFPKLGLQDWKSRKIWREEVDLPSVRRYLMQQHLERKALMDRVKQSRSDFKRWSNHISLDPLKLFIDTSNPRTLFYLKELMLHLAEIFVQDEDPILWMLEQEQHATTLFGTLRFGFSPALKEALHQESGKLISGFADIANIATRVGELNNVLNHPEFANSPWMNTLKQPARDTFAALQALARSGTVAMGKLTEKLLLIFTPLDARLAAGEHRNLPALLRNLLMGQVLTNAPNRLKISPDIPGKLHEWKQERARLHQQLQSLQRRWFVTEPWGRRGLTRELESLTQKIQAHEIKIPALLDYQNGQYTTAVKTMMSDFIAQGKTTAADWAVHSKQWMQSRSISLSLGVSVGVVLINFLNTALVTTAAIQDGEVSNPELMKIGYNLGYTASLFMSIFVSAPWTIINNMPVVKVGETSIPVLDRSAAYWKSQGHRALSKAVSDFRARMFAAGSLALGAVLLELFEIRNDINNAKTLEEQNLHAVKGLVVLSMGAIAALQTITAQPVQGRLIAGFTMGRFPTQTNLFLGFLYLIISFALNSSKQGALEIWLSATRWSRKKHHKFPDTPLGRREALRKFTEILLCLDILSKRTMRKYLIQTETGNQYKDKQDGAWVQLRIPSFLRNKNIRFEILVTPEENNDDLKNHFLKNGEYKDAKHWGKLEDLRPPTASPQTLWPALDKQKDIVWQTWVPLSEHAKFLTLQIWYPQPLLTSLKNDIGYKFELKLTGAAASPTDAVRIPMTDLIQNQLQNTEKIFVIP